MTDPDQPGQSDLAYDLSVMTAIRAGYWRARAEKEIVLLLAGLVTVITLLYYGLTMDATMAALSASSRGVTLDPTAFETGLGPGYWLGLFFFMYFYIGPMLVWARVSMLGRDAALEGGLAALARRMMWGLWRYICLMGWTILLIVALMIVGGLLGLILGVASGFDTLVSGGGGVDPAAGMTTGMTIFAILLYLAMAVPMLLLLGAWMISLNAEARDVHLSINKTFKILGRKAWALAGAIFIVWLAVLVVFVLLMTLLGPAIVGDGLSVPAILFLLAIFTFGGAIVNFAVLSTAGYYAAHLVPELME